MTKPQEKLRKDLLAKIHLHDKYKEIKSGEAWEEWLNFRFDVQSSKDLSIRELYTILDLLNEKKEDVSQPLFYVDKQARKEVESRARKQKFNADDNITQSQINYMQGLFTELGYDELEQRKFIKKQTGKMYLHFEPMKKSEGTKVIIGLEKISSQRISRSVLR